MVHSLGQFENGVHEEPCVSRRHGIDGVLPYDVSIKTNQALTVEKASEPYKQDFKDAGFEECDLVIVVQAFKAWY